MQLCRSTKYKRPTEWYRDLNAGNVKCLLLQLLHSLYENNVRTVSQMTNLWSLAVWIEGLSLTTLDYILKCLRERRPTFLPRCIDRQRGSAASVVLLHPCGNRNIMMLKLSRQCTGVINVADRRHRHAVGRCLWWLVISADSSCQNVRHLCLVSQLTPIGAPCVC